MFGPLFYAVRTKSASCPVDLCSFCAYATMSTTFLPLYHYQSTFVPPRCSCDSLRCRAYGTFCYGILWNVIVPVYITILCNCDHVALAFKFILSLCNCHVLQGNALVKAAFLDLPYLAASISIVKDFILVGDVQRGAQFLRYR